MSVVPIKVKTSLRAPCLALRRQAERIVVSGEDGQGPQSLEQLHTSGSSEVIVADARIPELLIARTRAQDVPIRWSQGGQPFDSAGIIARCDLEIAMPSLPADGQHTGTNQSLQVTAGR